MGILNIFKRKNKIATGPTTGNRSTLSLKRSINDINAKLETIDLDNINQQFNGVNTKITNLTNEVNANYGNTAKLNSANTFTGQNTFNNNTYFKNRVEATSVVSFRNSANQEKLWYDPSGGNFKVLKAADTFTNNSELINTSALAYKLRNRTVWTYGGTNSASVDSSWNIPYTHGISYGDKYIIKYTFTLSLKSGGIAIVDKTVYTREFIKSENIDSIYCGEDFYFTSIGNVKISTQTIDDKIIIKWDGLGSTYNLSLKNVTLLKWRI